ncbi:MAG TPA: hypothetical protein VMF53_10435 [Alphaproteobacteria bacterium]|nr:hypothetical protein [Alphaproteobacteria bacterium]
MKSGIVLAAAMALAALTFGAAARADNQVGSYDGQCNYRCCDQNNNCAVNSFYHGSGQGSLPTACVWEDVCAKQGQIGWSWSPYPLSKANSSLKFTKGCWAGWLDKNGRFYIKPC